MHMITCLDDLHREPVVVVLYPAGSSGEFIAHMLSQTTRVCAESSASWDGPRCKFQDFYGRSLNAGDIEILPHKVIERVNLYLNSIIEKRQYYVGLAHPHPHSSIDFLNTYARHCHVIEIIKTTQKSRDFTFAAANLKITHKPTLVNRPHYRSDIKAQTLIIEWSDLFIDKVDDSLDKIFKFIGSDAPINPAKELISEYLALNKPILDSIT